MTASDNRDIFQLGDLLNNTYRIEAVLGRGGTSEVYKARSDISGKVMAIKALRAEYSSNDDFLMLMTREEDVREIRHESVVRYFDTQRTPEGVVYLVMEHVDGPMLDEKLEEGGMDADALLTIGERVCAGLVAAHGRGIVHRDLSPDNIILRNDQPDEAVIIDFGIAKDLNPGAETIVGNEFAGKFAYAAPEQLGGQTDARSDIYALGALLLATFRGKTPFVGDNLIEVIKTKSLPLNTDGVPDPLRLLINKMTDPEASGRFQSADELLAAFKDPDSIVLLSDTPEEADEETDDDALPGSTVVGAPAISPEDIPAPLEAATILPTSEAVAKPVPATSDSQTKPDPAPQKKEKSSGILVPLLLGIAVFGGGTGAYFSGALDSVLGGYPSVEPYTLVIERSEDGSASAFGHVPSPEVQDALDARATALEAEANLTLASGTINPNWGDGVVEMLGVIDGLDEFRLDIKNDAVTITGLAATSEAREAVQEAFESGFPEGFSGSFDIDLGPRFLQPSDLTPVLEAHSDCGRLQMPTPPPLGFGQTDTIIVTGRFADSGMRDSLEASLRAVAGDRPVRIEGEVLNGTLCQIDTLLPSVASGGYDVRFGYGDRDAINLSGRYKVGENPTIDVRLPENVTDGFLWVSVVDVQGIVFHLLPNRTRPDNSIAALRQEATDGFIRVAYGLEEAQAEGRLAFTVDDSVLGKSKILVLQSEKPLFDDLRPTTESAASYADALISARDTGGLYVNNLDSAILETAR